MPDMASSEISRNSERRKDVAWEAAHVTQEAINFFDAKPLVKKGLDFFVRGWRSRLAEFVGDPLCELASRANYDGFNEFSLEIEESKFKFSNMKEKKDGE